MTHIEDMQDRVDAIINALTLDDDKEAALTVAWDLKRDLSDFQIIFVDLDQPGV